MKMITTHTKIKSYLAFSESGYAILFAVIMIGIILAISIGLSDIAYKQLVISSVANDSQLAFYESDTATECALYENFIPPASTGVLEFSSATPTSPISCGVDNNGANYSMNVAYSTDGSSNNTYILTPSNSAWTTSIEPCFTISVLKSASGATTIAAKGYNMCDKTNPQTVEREIDASF